MKALPLLLLALTLSVWAWLALGLGPAIGASHADRPGAGEQTLVGASGETSGLRGDREGSDEATSVVRTRSRSRIGPQPWPDDLPDAWPIVPGARVLADTTREPGDRLLLVDWPARPERALRSLRRTLTARGFEVSEPRTRRVRHALHARSGQTEVVLTFHPRNDASRVEILFLAPTTG